LAISKVSGVAGEANQRISGLFKGKTGDVSARDLVRSRRLRGLRSAITKGAVEGVVCRHSFAGGDSPHAAKGGSALVARLPSPLPGTVHAGMKMPGHWGKSGARRKTSKCFRCAKRTMWGVAPPRRDPGSKGDTSHSGGQ